MKTFLTQHTNERISERLDGLVTMQEIIDCALNADPAKSRYWEVKRIAYTEIADPAVKPDGIARGDQIVIVIDQVKSNYVVKTVMLRKSWSKFSDGLPVLKIK